MYLVVPAMLIGYTLFINSCCCCCRRSCVCMYRAVDKGCTNVLGIQGVHTLSMEGAKHEL